MHAVSSTVVRLAAIALAASTGFAQTCVTVIPDGTVGLGTPSGSSIPVVPRFATTWDPDGPGPQTTKLLVERGRFGFPDSSPLLRSNDVLVTDGDTFEIIPRPTGVQLFALGVYQNQIYALGRNELPPGVSVTLYRRTGDTWESRQLPQVQFFPGASVQTPMIETPAGMLITNLTPPNSTTLIFLMVDPATGAGSVQPVSGFARGIAKVGDALYAFGDLQLNGTASSVVRYVNGQWQAADSIGGLRPTVVRGVAEFQGRVLAIARFFLQGIQTDGLLELTAEGWTDTGLRLGADGQSTSLMATADALIATSRSRLLRIENETIDSRTLILVDQFGSSSNIWHELVGVWNDRVVVRTNAAVESAEFEQPQGDLLYVGMVGGVYLSDGAEALNFSPALNAPVLDLINFQGHTYAVGAFRSAAGQSVRSVARRENGVWRPINMENGPQGRAIDATIWNDRLTVAWSKPRQGAQFPDNFISSWDGESWTTINGPAGVNASRIEASSTDLYFAGSNFNSAPLFRLVGDQWVPLPPPLFGSLVRLGNDLYIGSQKLVGDQLQPQQAADTGVRVTAYANFGGRPIGYGGTVAAGTAGWYELRNGLWTRFAVGDGPSFVLRFLPYGHELLTAQSPISNGFEIRSWNGATWKSRVSSSGQIALASRPGIEFRGIHCLTIDAESGQVLFGSTLRNLFNATTDFTGLLDFTPRISFSRVPLPTRVLPGNTTTLRAQVVSQGQFTYQWTRDDVALVDGVLPTGEVISGATTPTLTITNSTAAVNGSYMLTVTPVDASLFCGPESTFPIPVTVERFCDSIDFNNNFVFPEDQDVIDFLSVLAGGQCSTPSCNDIDFNNNTIFPEDQDVIDFFNVLAGAACP